jgi:hypothetical protein
MSLLEHIIANGNRFAAAPMFTENWVRCRDGFKMSVIAGYGAYSIPRPIDDSHTGPYRAVEVGYPSARPEPWDQWLTYAECEDDPTGTVYSQVPVDVVRALVALHGGETS